jgi:hypothetical protein
VLSTIHITDGYDSISCREETQAGKYSVVHEQLAHGRRRDVSKWGFLDFDVAVLSN